MNHLAVFPLTGGTGATLVEGAFRPDFAGVPCGKWKMASKTLYPKGYVHVWIDEDAAEFDARVAGRADVKVLHRDDGSGAPADAAFDPTDADDLPPRRSHAEMLASWNAERGVA